MKDVGIIVGASDWEGLLEVVGLPDGERDEDGCREEDGVAEMVGVWDGLVEAVGTSDGVIVGVKDCEGAYENGSSSPE